MVVSSIFWLWSYFDFRCFGLGGSNFKLVRLFSFDCDYDIEIGYEISYIKFNRFSGNYIEFKIIRRLSLKVVIYMILFIYYFVKNKI